MNKIFKSWSLFEIVLLLIGLISTFIVSIIWKSDVLTTACAIVAIFCALLLAKGKPSGNVWGVILVFLYSVVSFNNKLYGEVILYVFIMLPLYIISIVQWRKNIRKKDKTVVAYDIKDKEWALISATQGIVFVLVYFFLRLFDTNLIIFSSLSFYSLIYTVYLGARRSKYSFLYYFINDIVLVFLWGSLALEGNLTVIPIVISPFLSCIYDIYGIINWQKMNANIIKISDLEYKELNKRDLDQIEELVDIASKELLQGQYIPYTKEEKSKLFEPNHILIYGIFNKKELVGKADIVFDQEMILDSKKVLGLEQYKCCQIRRVLDKQNYRHKEILYNLIKLQVESVKKQAFNYIIAFADSKDYLIINALKKAGFKYEKSMILENGLIREYYLIKV